ncbi:hypothetical protein [Photorhabdus akhurstii]
MNITVKQGQLIIRLANKG